MARIPRTVFIYGQPLHPGAPPPLLWEFELELEVEVSLEAGEPQCSVTGAFAWAGAREGMVPLPRVPGTIEERICSLAEDEFFSDQDAQALALEAEGWFPRSRGYNDPESRWEHRED